jgi:RHS repeat-associated protein
MTYDAGNQLMSRTDAAGTVDFVYDSAGRLASERQNGESIAQYQYGYLDKVTQVTRGDQVTKFHYNANGMLVAKERDGQIVETFGWDGIGLIAKDDVVYANEAHVSGGVPLAAINAGSESAEMQYFDSDYLGTTTAVYSATGEVDAKFASSFGAGTESDEVRFTGKPYDADLDAHVFPYRNYKSEAGRWASADPAGFPDGPNQHYYACVPTMGLDPLGLAWVEINAPTDPNPAGTSWTLALNGGQFAATHNGVSGVAETRIYTQKIGEGWETVFTEGPYGVGQAISPVTYTSSQSQGTVVNASFGFSKVAVATLGGQYSNGSGTTVNRQISHAAIAGVELMAKVLVGIVRVQQRAEGWFQAAGGSWARISIGGLNDLGVGSDPSFQRVAYYEQ